MNKFLLFLLISISLPTFSQHSSGFDAQEARDCIQICNSFTYLNLTGSDDVIIPKDYQRIYTSESLGMDNKFQVYVNQSKTKAILNFRGSTDQQSSWLANMYSSMVPADDTIYKGKVAFHYKCAASSKAGIHAGYILATSYLMDEVLKQIEILNKQGIYTIYITGHSQGGALAQMTRAYLEFVPKSKLNSKNTFKVYAFANPMIGNMDFAHEYQKRFADPGLSFLIHNPADMVPKMPASYNDTTFWKSSFQNLISDRENFSFKDGMKDGLMSMMGSKMGQFSNMFSGNVQTQLVKTLGDFKMPKYQPESNYMHTSTPLLLPPTEYPLELKDSNMLANDSLMRIYKRDANGVFEDKSVYKKDKTLLQHKPYNYYTAILKVYFPTDYLGLKEKYFVLPKEIK
ncbi:lipase family protein [Fluviicola taffensis]|uniref:Lipase class 3 n=1 Tax=Fluviicola taffensis (strain DSM 16823 / NCIMB 13979 / RW262) TaxID=755732 RepID=F2IBJ6_FLUTR|nr:lipase family protein [Fluviicola taffensis]AEA44304.1 lipase class 3 [Fluviicola taffensis DSM 16823]